MAEIASKTVKQRYQEASYLKVGENFELMGTGFTELNEDPGAQTTSKKYINDKSSTSSITSYEGEHGFTADQIPSEKVIKDLVSIGKERKTGADAEREFVRVDLDDRAEKLGYRMREGQIQKVPYLLVIGFNEKDNRTVSYRLHGEKDTTVVGLDEFVKKIVDEIKNKVH